MELIVTDPELAKRLIAQRQEWEVDRFDEVWDGTYIIAPIADDTHQDLQASLGTILYNINGLKAPPHVYMGVIISDRVEGFEQNYR